MLRQLKAFILKAIIMLVLMASPAVMAAQETEGPPVTKPGRSEPASGLDDILARQRSDNTDAVLSLSGGEKGVPAFHKPGQSDLLTASDFWGAIRHNDAETRVSTKHPAGKVLIQERGITWQEVRKGPLARYGGLLLLGTGAALALFYLLRGTVPVEGGMAGRTITRFKAAERFAHWLLAGSFLLLAVTGLLTLFGRMYVAPFLGKDFNSALLAASKLIHNNVAWAFMLGLVLVFVFWVWHNLPDRTDLTWFAQAGGIIGNKHPPAKKFNGGQKIIFWSVILLGGAISITGLSLLIPFELQMFAPILEALGDIGAPEWIGISTLDTNISPQEEMQFAHIWHATLAFVLIAIIIAHIYIGTLGMEGAYDAMGSGQVDTNWARQHHSIWLEEVEKKRRLSK